MLESFSGLGTAQQVYWACAVISSTFFVMQTIAMLIGIGGDSADFDSVDADTGMSEGGVASEAMQMFTVRNCVNFFLGFGWGGVCLEKYFESGLLLALTAVAVGVLFVVLFVFLYKKMMKLEHSGNIDIERDVVGKEADVYLVIHAGARGKVQFSVNGSVHEYEAVSTDPAAEIPTGARVRITGHIGTNTLTVEKL